MLKQLRDEDPTLASFKKALNTRSIVGQKYAETTIKSYAWHVRNFIRFCAEKEVNPKTVSNEILRAYLRGIQKDVKSGEVTRGFFLQACTSLETFFFTLKNYKKAEIIPSMRSTLAN